MLRWSKSNERQKQEAVRILNKNRVNCPAFRSVIHQPTHFSKEIRINSTINIAVNIINKIRGDHNALRHGKFKDFLENLNFEYGNILLYTEVH